MSEVTAWLSLKERRNGKVWASVCVRRRPLFKDGGSRHGFHTKEIIREQESDDVGAERQERGSVRGRQHSPTAAQGTLSRGPAVDFGPPNTVADTRTPGGPRESTTTDLKEH